MGRTSDASIAARDRRLFENALRAASQTLRVGVCGIRPAAVLPCMHGHQPTPREWPTRDSLARKRERRAGGARFARTGPHPSGGFARLCDHSSLPVRHGKHGAPAWTASSDGKTRAFFEFSEIVTHRDQAVRQDCRRVLAVCVCHRAMHVWTQTRTPKKTFLCL